MGSASSQEQYMVPGDQEAPPPSPARTRKEDIFKKEDYAYADLHVAKISPELIHGSFEDLIAYLTLNKDWDDVAKIRAIFIWIASVDIYRLPLSSRPSDDSPLACFYKIRFNPSYDYADLLERMCKLASIPCVKLLGKRRVSDDRFGAGKWNAVYVAGSWRLIDLSYACICVVGMNTGEWAVLESDGNLVNEDKGDISSGISVHTVNEFYFLTDPEKFIWDHFPDQSAWQLLKIHVTLKQFEEHFYVEETFYEIGMINTPATKQNYIVETTNGETDFTFGLPEDRSFALTFSYNFYRARNVQKNRKQNAVLETFVMFEHREDLLRFSLRFPITGKFKLEIYGNNINESLSKLCCSYVINCPKAKEGCLPLPDCPPVGWGPNQATKATGLTPRTHKEAKVVTKDGYIEIRLSKEKALAFHQMLKHHHLDDATLSKYSVTELDGDEAVVYLRLPQKGEYALKLFAQGLDEKGTAPNVLNYLIHSDQEMTHNKRFPNTTTGQLGRDETNSKEFGVNALSYSGGKLITKEGNLTLDFEVNSNIMELLCEMHTLDSAAASKMSSSITSHGNKWKFDLNMPVNGEYSLNVFARRKEDPAQVYHVHTYLIKSSGRGDGAKAHLETTAAGTSIPTKTLETSDQEMMVPVPPDVSRATAAIHKRTGNEAPDPNKIKFLSANGKNQFKVKLKDYSEYMLNVYSVDDTGKLLTNVSRYQINRKLPSQLNQKGFQELMKELQAPTPETTPVTTPVITEKETKKHLKQDIQNALKSNDESELEQAIANFLEYGGEESNPLIKKARQQLETIKDRAANAKKHLRNDIQKAKKTHNQRELKQAIAKFLENGGEESDPFIKKAREQLEIIKARANLKKAYKQRNKSALEKAIARADTVNRNQELDIDIEKAMRLRDHLVKRRKLRHAMLKIHPATISEIKSYSKPPDGVYQCLMATFLLLGHHLHEVKEWHNIQALLRKSGKESLMRKVSKFDSETVSLNIAMIAKKTLSPYSKEQIQDVSAGAATFYTWAVGAIDDAESSQAKDPTQDVDY